MTDECHAHLSVVVHKQNLWYWETENPGDASTEMVPRLILKAAVWVAVAWYGVIGPSFFEDNQGCTCTVSQANYREMIQNFYLTEFRAQLARTPCSASKNSELSPQELRALPARTPCSASKRNHLIKMKSQWFQQHRGSPHTAGETRLFLKRHFDGRFISLYDTVEWPSHSSDLTLQISFYGGNSRTGFIEILGLVLSIN